MKKTLLTLAFILAAGFTTMAATIDDICGVYLEHTTGQQALSFLCGEYNAVDITNLVVVSKNASGKLQFYGFYKTPNFVKGSFDESTQTITFSAQKWNSSDGYNFCKAGKVSATVDADGVITIPNWSISFGSDLYSKEMNTTLSPVKADYTATGTISAPGYFDGSATLTAYNGHYLLQEGSEMAYQHYFTLNSNSNVVFPWATVIYSTDKYCYIYNTMEAEDLLMLDNATGAARFTNDGKQITLTSPFQYYEDFSDEQQDNPTPDAVGTYTATFDIPAGIGSVSTSQLTPNHTSTLYNLSGQRLNRLQRGVNIVDGKKLIVR